MDHFLVTPVSKLARLSLALVPDRMVAPILSGPARGMRWIVGAGVKSYWTGTYESECAVAFARLLAPDDVVFDIGANVGYYTLLAARRAYNGTVVAFEPCPRNRAYLERHIELNDLEVNIRSEAVADEDGTAWLDQGAGKAQGTLAVAGDLLVTTVALDHLCATGDLPEPTVLKIDVEGAELRVLEGARALLASARPRILLEMHNTAMEQACPALLRDYGYELEPVKPWRGQAPISGTFLARPT